jgi:hypothetical protein
MPEKKTPASAASQLPVPTQLIERRIYLIRGQKVMLDSDLAELYQVATKVFNQAVQRNKARFPEDFMFQLSKEELENWRSQFVTSNPALKMGLRRRPYAFTEHGVAMLATVLRSKRAVEMSLSIVRAFIRMRELLASHKDMAARLEKVETTQRQHGAVLVSVVEEIKKLKTPPATPPKRRIGFKTSEDQ